MIWIINIIVDVIAFLAFLIGWTMGENTCLTFIVLIWILNTLLAHITIYKEENEH